jgi:hypothetical protein
MIDFWKGGDLASPEGVIAHEALDLAGYVIFRPLFAEVIDERYYPLEWLDSRVLDGSTQFRRSDNAAVIFEQREYPGGVSDVHGLVAAGDLAEIVTELIPLAERWGRNRGCLAAVIESRPGWAKALSAFGYETHQLAIRKEL